MGNDGENNLVKEEQSRNQDSAPYHFGQGLRRLRKERDLSQKELGRRIEQPRSAIGRWEKQPGAPKWSTIERLAIGLGVRATELLPLGDQADGAREIPEATNLLPLEYQAERAPEIPKATNLLPAREEEIAQLKGEVESLRKVVLNLVEAAAAAKRDPKERRIVDAAWMKLKEEARRIELDELVSAVESIGAEDE